MAIESTQQTRIIPAIPLTFKKKQQQFIKAPKGADGSSNPVNHNVKAPLTPESAASVPIRGTAEPQTRARHEDSSAATNGHDDGVEQANAHVPAVIPLSAGAAPATPASTPSRAESHEYVDDSQSSARDESHVNLNTTPPSHGILHQEHGRDSKEQNQDSPSYTGNNGSLILNGHHSGSETRAGAQQLVFGDMAEDSRPTFEALSPVTHLPHTSFPPHTINVAAPPFYPPGGAPAFANPQTTAGYQATPTPSVPYPTHIPLRSWVPHEAYPYATAPMNQNLNPTGHPAHEVAHSRQISENALRQDRHELASELPAALPMQTRSTEPQGLASQDKATPSAAEGAPLSDYILSQFGQLAYADCVLEVYLPELSMPLMRLPLHRMIAARSPRLASQLAERPTSMDFDAFGMRALRLEAGGKFVTTAGLINALRHLYGAALRSSDHLDAQNEAMVAEALELAAAGKLLQLPDVERHGLRLAQSHIDWTSIETCLAYTGEDDEMSYQSAVTSAGSNTGEDFRLSCIDFLACHVPQYFLFDTTAPQLPRVSRLPSNTAGSHSSASDPRLNQIQFGEMEDADRSQDQQAFISSILVSIPFSSLKVLFEHPNLRHRLDASALNALQRSVVSERERRRVRAARASRRPKAQHIGDGFTGDKPGHDALQWVERLEPSGADGELVFTRTRRPGATTPNTPTTREI